VGKYKKFTSIEWEQVFNSLPSILSNMQLERVLDNKYLSPFKVGGAEPKHPKRDKTALFITDSRTKIYLKEVGEEKLSLEDTLQEYYGFASYGAVMDYLKSVVSPNGSFSSAPFETPQKKEQLPQRKEVIRGFLPSYYKRDTLQIGFSKVALQYLNARGLYYRNEWELLSSMGSIQDSYGDTHLLLRWKDPNNSEAGLYKINCSKSLSSSGALLPRSKRESVKGWIKGQGIKQSNARGGAIRTAPHKNGVIGICEGLEDALSIMQMIGYFMEELGASKESIQEQREQYQLNGGEYNSYPVWAVLSKENLSSFIAPQGVHTVYYFPDMERDSRNIVFEELQKQGIAVIRVDVPFIKGYQPKDWNTYLQAINNQVERGQNDY
jgi:hypothetical protein